LHPPVADSQDESRCSAIHKLAYARVVGQFPITYRDLRALSPDLLASFARAFVEIFNHWCFFSTLRHALRVAMALSPLGIDRA